jgi:hypothetical protein
MQYDVVIKDRNSANKKTWVIDYNDLPEGDWIWFIIIAEFQRGSRV